MTFFVLNLCSRLSDACASQEMTGSRSCKAGRCSDILLQRLFSWRVAVQKGRGRAAAPKKNTPEEAKLIAERAKVQVVKMHLDERYTMPAAAEQFCMRKMLMVIQLLLAVQCITRKE